MTLDETAYSDVNDPALLQEIHDAAYHGPDIRPAWIGAHRPRTEDASRKGLMNWAAAHYDYYLNFVRDHVERLGRILDLGCGAGQNTAMLARYAELAAGIDIDQTVIDFARKHNKSSGAFFTCASFPESSTPQWGFDYIFCIETMEHIARDRQIAFLDAALGMLNEGGRMFITTPNEQGSGSAPHIGIWNREWVNTLSAHLGKRVVRSGYFDNTKPEGWADRESTHHAWVLR